MKFSDKLLAIKAGASMADIKQMEAEEAEEIKATKEQDNDAMAESEELLTALEAANKAIEEKDIIIASQKDEIKELNENFTKLINLQTVNETTAYTADDVMKELFNHKAKKEV